MRVALIASPFISVPPVGYEWLADYSWARLAEALVRLGVEVDVYANGESRVNANLRWRYSGQDWPLLRNRWVDERARSHRLGCRVR